MVDPLCVLLDLKAAFRTYFCVYAQIRPLKQPAIRGSERRQFRIATARPGDFVPRRFDGRLRHVAHDHGGSTQISVNLHIR
ncbi:hypothetical protein A1354_25470 [Pseudomonas asplenii]|nr:hypothetical protein A1354_25470 [Pseudomonas asplenii]